MQTSTCSRAFIARLPKAELHLHLEGSLRPETLRELCTRKGRSDSAVEQWIAEREKDGYRYGDFGSFIQAFLTVAKIMEAPEDYALAATRLIEQLGRENVRYAEITISAGVVLWKKQSLEAVFEAVSEAARAAGRRTGVGVQWIFDGVRHFGHEHVRQVLQWAVRFRERGVVAFGIGGDEVQGPARWFQDVFREAREAGLRITVHAGETAGPESIRDAVELLGAERIGHGLTAAQDANVMAMLRERKIPLEVCPTSNVSTGCIPRIEDHPLPKFIESGLMVTLNSDDPGMFGTSIEREFQIGAGIFGLAENSVAQLSENAIRAAFLPEEKKKSLLDALHAAIAEPVPEPEGNEP